MKNVFFNNRRPHTITISRYYDMSTTFIRQKHLIFISGR